VDLKLISYALCPYVHRAAIVLREKGVAYETQFIDLENKPARFVAISPRGKVPVLVADGVAIFESAVINEFLDETHPPRMLPEDPFERAVQRAWVEVANDLFAAQYKVFAAPNAAELEAATTALEPVLARFEQALRDGPLEPDRFGLVHAAVAPAFCRFVVAEKRWGARLMSTTPQLEAYSRTLSTRPSVAGTVIDQFADQLVTNFAARGSQLARQGSST
jgi:glutathione S-transferase